MSTTVAKPCKSDIIMSHNHHHRSNSTRPSETHSALTSEIDMTIHARINGGGNATKKKIDCRSYIVSCVLLLCLMGLSAGAISYRVFAHIQDRNWNDIVDGQKPFSSVGNCTYFAGKTFRFHFKDHAKLREYLTRDVNLNLVFVGLNSFFAIITLFLFCSFVDPTNLKEWFCLGFVLNYLSLLFYLSLDDKYESFDSLEVYYHLDRYSNTTAGSFAPRNIQEIAILKQVVRLCQAQFGNDNSVGIQGQLCKKRDLVHVGFCRDYDSRLIAAVFTCFLCVFCLVVIFLVNILEARRLKRDNDMLATTVPSDCPSRPVVQITGSCYCPAYPPFNEADYDNHNGPLTSMRRELANLAAFSPRSGVLNTIN